MEFIKTLYISGYRNAELNIFQPNDPKIPMIKHVLRTKILEYQALGLEWVLISGNLGVEMWAGEVVLEMKKTDASLQLGLIFPFEHFGEKWQETNQQALANLKKHADYVNAVSHKTYNSPKQLVSHTHFILQHTQGSLLIYDSEYPGKSQYFVKAAQQFAENASYLLQFVTMDDLQNSIEY